MAQQIRISKSDYVLGQKCPRALWIKKHRPDIEFAKDETVLARGTVVGELACDYYPGGVRIEEKPWTDAALQQTRAAMASNVPAIYEATFATDTGEYCAVDILVNNGDGTWNIVEVKSSTHAKDYHFIDVSFQRYVLVRCGVNIRDCFVMTLNKDYVRHGDIDIHELFKLWRASDELQDLDFVRDAVARLHSYLAGDMPNVALSKATRDRFYDCGYCHFCWADVPRYSVFDAFRNPTADKVYSKYGADLRNVPPAEYAGKRCGALIKAFLGNKDIVNVPALRDFCSKLQYPLYFLDYESIQPAVPMFDNSRPYQQICFQFSLHKQLYPGAPLIEYGYLHNTSGTDPRPKLIERLIQFCEDQGSIIVYNDTAERVWNEQMARDFPEYAAALHAINSRMIDLLEPFKNFDLYRPCQNGSASIKQTLPAFVPEMSYENLGIHNGAQASEQFMDFMTGNQTPEQTEQMMLDLHEYCGQDTLAMVRLLDVVRGFIDK